MADIVAIQISIELFLVYLAIAAACIPLVRVLGPVAISTANGGGGYRLEETYDVISGFSNVIYRIISPVLCCAILTLVLSSLLEVTIGYSTTDEWIPVLLYWVILAIIKCSNNKMAGKVMPFSLELATSVLISYLFNKFVFAELAEGNIGVLDSSNYAFQMEMAALYAIVQLIVSLFVRIKYRVNYASALSDSDARDEKSVARRSSVIDTSEKKLFSYVRKYGELLPLRYEQDPLLRAVFYSIMAIEDGNRPRAIRLLERMAYRVKLSKTTGIMQQAGGKPLTDEESVQLAVGYVERMWDSFLRAFAKSAQGRRDGVSMYFGRTWYKYDYQALSEAIEDSFSSLYGDYCGTRLLNANIVFQEVKRFQERNHYGLSQECIVARGMLFETELNWLSGQEAYWANEYSIRSNDDGGESANREVILYREGAAIEDVDLLCASIKESRGRVFRVDFLDQCFAKVFCVGIEDALLDGFESQWVIRNGDK